MTFFFSEDQIIIDYGYHWSTGGRFEDIFPF
jgi:hypothetical protein